MIKYRLIINSILFLFLIALGTLAWRTSLLFDNLTNMLSETEINSKTELDTKIIYPKETVNINTSVPIFFNNNLDHHETIEETIARIKRDVIVTGTVIGTPGKESALFQIENMPDRAFNINTQLMDGFIITEITQNQVSLKNQNGDEFFSLPVQSGNYDEAIQAELINSVFLPEAKHIETELPEETEFLSDADQEELRREALRLIEPESTESVNSPQSRSDKSRPDEFRPIEPEPTEPIYPIEPRPDGTYPAELRHDEPGSM